MNLSRGAPETDTTDKMRERERERGACLPACMHGYLNAWIIVDPRAIM